MNETYDHELETIFASSYPSFDDKLKIRSKYLALLAEIKLSSAPSVMSKDDGHQQAIIHLHNLDNLKKRIESYASIHKIDLHP